MKKRNWFGAAVTVGLSAAILFAGTFLTSWIDRLVPSDRNQITEIADTNSNSGIYRFDRQEEFRLYPWNYVTDKNQSGLTTAQKELLKQKKVTDFICSLLNIAQEPESSPFSMINLFRQINVPDSNEKYFVLDHFNILNSDVSVNCVVTSEGDVISCYTDHTSQKITDDSLQKAESFLQNSIVRKSNDLPDYIKKVIALSDNYNQRLLFYKMQRKELISALPGDELQVVASGNKILLDYEPDNSSSIIFYYDPVTLSFCGFDLQQSKE